MHVEGSNAPFLLIHHRRPFILNFSIYRTTSASSLSARMVWGLWIMTSPTLALRISMPVLVLRNNRTYLLISRYGRDWNDDWMFDRARNLLD